MLLPDVNVLIHAFRTDAPRHTEYRSWLGSVVNGSELFGMSDHVLSGFLRIMTNSSLPLMVAPVEKVWGFANAIRDSPNCVRIIPGPAHWEIFQRLCEEANAEGNLVPDAYFAALAIESGCEWVTDDRDFRRFKGLRWRHPLGD